MVRFKEITYIGTPGHICVVRNSDPRYEGLPSRGLAWGPFDENGKFALLIDCELYPVIIMHEMDPTPEVVRHLEENWHLNTAS